MAIIRLGPLVGGISGSIAGVNFAHTRGATIARSRPAKVNQRTEKKLLRRSRYMLYRNQWLDLSPEQQTAWRTQARQVNLSNRLGQKIRLSGWQYYMGAALSLPVELTAMPQLPPATIHAIPILTLTASFTQGGPMTIGTTIQGPGVFRSLRLYVSRPMSSLPRQHFANWKYAGFISTNVNSNNWNTNIEKYIGLLLADEVIGLRMHRQVFAAFLSTPLFISTTVT
jgi:hypothetical protein